MSEIKPYPEDVERLRENKAFQAFMADVHKEWTDALTQVTDAADLDAQRMAFAKGKFHALDFVKRGALHKIASAAEFDLNRDATMEKPNA